MCDSHIGGCGHIAFTVPSIDNAIEYLNEMGWQADSDTAACTLGGKLKMVYLTQEICGFAIHLVEEL